ncbi:SPASM domain-containing protein [Kutzneria sp. NPDC052558]|uniref:SPASM domain-containing protein n=1 Tax=Kutzneria sp. NPDC052558 TaxID=3364121 RepID=UPI0037CAADE4
MVQKASRYLVVSDSLYTDGDKRPVRLVLNTRTSRVSPVGDAVACTLRAGDCGPLPDDVAEQLTELDILVPDSRDELTDVLDEQRARARSLASLNYALVPAGFCNMGCEYCGQVHVRGKSTANHRDAVRDRVLRGISRPSTEEVHVGWFGNEPLLSYEIVRGLAAQFVTAADDRGVRYTSTMTTGGALLTPRRLRALYEECRIHAVQAVIDPARPYQRILSVLAGLMPEEFPLLRMTIRCDLADVAEVDAFIDAALAAGLNRPMFEFELRAAATWPRARFAAAEPRWLRRMQEAGLGCGTLIPSPLARPLCPAVTRTAEVISSSGAIFSCTEHPLVPAHEQADILELVAHADHNRQRPAGRYDDWHDRVNRGQQPCSSCPFLPTCGGRCPKRWDDGAPACPSYKHNIQQRLDLVAAKSGLLRCS